MSVDNRTQTARNALQRDRALQGIGDGADVVFDARDTPPWPGSCFSGDEQPAKPTLSAPIRTA